MIKPGYTLLNSGIPCEDIATASVKTAVCKILPEITCMSDGWTDSDKQDMINRSHHQKKTDTSDRLCTDGFHAVLLSRGG